jgi:aminoglycoside 3-N-acetyltransferase
MDGCVGGLRDDLLGLGVAESSVVLVHASLRAMAPTRRTPGELADALLAVLGPAGTVVVPTQTSWNSTTSRAFKAATQGMAPEEIAAYKGSLPPFDPLSTPSWGMGQLAEYIRTLPNAVRSIHPQTSFAAVGAQAVELLRVHDLESHLGPDSPLGALYAHDAWVLMLGTDYSTGTVFHLAEYMYTAQPLRSYECRIARGPGLAPDAPNGWTSFKDIDFDDSDFGFLGECFERGSDRVRQGPVGGAWSRLYPVRSAVDFAAAWMREHRG